jgi:hypothetical protein
LDRTGIVTTTVLVTVSITETVFEFWLVVNALCAKRPWGQKSYDHLLGAYQAQAVGNSALGRAQTNAQHALRSSVRAVPTEIRNSEYDGTQAHARIGFGGP